MDNLKTELDRVRAAVGDSLDIRNYLDAADQAFRFLRAHGEALAWMVRDAERYRFIRDETTPTAEIILGTFPYGFDVLTGKILDSAIDQAMQESRDDS